ncbi:amino acid permease [Halalkalibaculum sp. DA3122]|uniref:amino acid permease n=1 Tax=Halalkalibaculum sp. DA3122 TaxID=3373607 RepID=UPI0037543D19
MPKLKKSDKLKKELNLFDVYAIATGAMFSSGFFLLPGIAAAETGPSVFLAYLVSGLLILPTMFSVAELSTALPRAGGTYYIIDRSLGPLMGSIGGFGSWLALVLKSAFALIGMGAYIALFYDINITVVAIGLTIAFGMLNIVGAKETTTLQKVLVAALITIMFGYLVEGIGYLLSMDILGITEEQFTPFFTKGASGFFATVGMVFVSYAGLTKVASIAEEVKDPDRNIPLGMFLSVLSAITVYVLGVYLMVAVLEPEAFRQDLTPVATAGEVFMDWLPGDVGLILIVIAAIAAFASTGNAGIMSASRYPMAMARDSLFEPRFAKLGRFNTPQNSILATVGLMIFFLLAFNVASVAKLASAFQLLLFALLNLGVIVMRESKIEEYDPGFNAPWYPWLQIAGMVLSFVLIFEMGILSILFTVAVSAFSVGWYYYYAHSEIDRQGAIFHIHARLGEKQDSGLEHEMRGILREKGLREEDPYEEVVARSMVIDDLEPNTTYREIIRMASSRLAVRVNLDQSEMFDSFCNINQSGLIPMGRGVALNHLRVEKDISSEMVLVRMKEGITMDTDHFEQLSQSAEDPSQKVRAFIFLISSEKHSSSHLRILAHLAEMIDNKHFMDRWLAAEDEGALREIMLRDERFINLKVTTDDMTAKMIGKKIKDIELPGKSLVAILKRDNDIIIPHGNTEIHENDELSIIGDSEDIDEVRRLKRGGN